MLLIFTGLVGFASYIYFLNVNEIGRQIKQAEFDNFKNDLSYVEKEIFDNITQFIKSTDEFFKNPEIKIDNQTEEFALIEIHNFSKRFKRLLKSNIITNYESLKETVFSVASSLEYMENAAEFKALIDEPRDIVKLQNNLSRRDVVLRNLEQARVERDSYDSGAFDLQNRIDAFHSFVSDCKSSNKIETEKCADNFHKLLPGGEKPWWTIIAEQAPAGILLLFLLATLSTLYRYNIRLAAFYHSRADALELISLEDDQEHLPIYATALAADTVPFGKAGTPTEQAIEMMKAIFGRQKKSP